MQTLKFFILFQIVAASRPSKPRSVNLALETVLEFDNSDDVKFLDTMQRYLDNIKRTISRNSPTGKTKLRQNYKKDEKDIKFSEFLENTITVLKSYSDEALKKFFTVLNKEIKKWHNQNPTLNDKTGFRRIVFTKLQDFKDSPANEIRRDLNALSKQLYYNKRNGETNFVADFLNYFYERESQVKLSRFLNNLKLYRTRTRRTTNLDLKTIIRNGIQIIVEPIMKMTSNAENNSLHKRYKNIKNKNEKVNVTVDQKDIKENEILDYIEDHEKVVETHISTIKFQISEDINGYKSSANDHKYMKTTKAQKLRKLKPKDSSSEEVVKDKLHKKKPGIIESISRLKKYFKNEDEEDTNTNLGAIKQPILLKIGSSVESSSDSDEQETKTTQQRRYKKFTRRLSTNKRYLPQRTTRQGRKAFKTTTDSDEGLSIEHFGSLHIIKSNRKNYDNDASTQVVVNTTSLYETKQNSTDIVTLVTITTDKTKRGNFNEQTQKYDVEERNSNVKSERKMKDDSKVELEHDIVSENIKLTGEIVFETLATDVQTTKTDEVVANDYPNKYAKLNASSLTTEYFGFKEMKPTIVVRGHNLNDTNITSHKPLTDLETATKTKTTVPPTQTDDGLENEIDTLIDKLNTSSTIPEHFNSFFKESQNDGDKRAKNVQNQMKADFKKPFDLSTTISTVAEAFNDSFKELDDILSE